MAKEKLSYKAALEELQQILNEIGNENTDIDELSAKVRRASYLISECKSRLRQTEDELNQILKDFGEAKA